MKKVLLKWRCRILKLGIRVYVFEQVNRILKFIFLCNYLLNAGNKNMPWKETLKFSCKDSMFEDCNTIDMLISIFESSYGDSTCTR